MGLAVAVAVVPGWVLDGVGLDVGLVVAVGLGAGFAVGVGVVVGFAVGVGAGAGLVVAVVADVGLLVGVGVAAPRPQPANILATIKYIYMNLNIKFYPSLVN